MVTWLVDGNALAGVINVSVGGATVAVEHRLLRGSTWRPPVSARNAVVEVPGRHGSVVSGMASFEPPTVTLVGSLSAPSENALEAALARLQGLLSRPAGVTLTRTSGLVTATAGARLLSWSQGDAIAKGVGPARSDWTAALTVPDVTFKGTVVNSASLAASSNTTLALPTLAGSSAPIRDAILRLSGPATSFSWTCPTSGTGISWTGTLAVGSYLYVDVVGLTAWITTYADFGRRVGDTDETSRLDYPAAGPLQLWPRVSGASTVVEVAIAGGGRVSGTTQLVVRAAPTYL